MGSTCPANSYSWAYSTAAASIVTANSFNEIVTALNDEITRRNTDGVGGGYTAQSSAGVGDSITAARWTGLSNPIAYYSSMGTNTFSAGNVNYSNKVDSGGSTANLYLKYWLNQARMACPCNCNYACTCNCNYACVCDCNYCVCNCNYCVCNCNYCVCNCNYACVCNCNYTPSCYDCATCSCNGGNSCC